MSLNRLLLVAASSRKYIEGENRKDKVTVKPRSFGGNNVDDPYEFLREPQGTKKNAKPSKHVNDGNIVIYVSIVDRVKSSSDVAFVLHWLYRRNETPKATKQQDYENVAL